MLAARNSGSHSSNRRRSVWRPAHFTLSHAIGLCLLGMLVWRIFNPIPVARDFSFDADETHRVERVIDGDTLQLKNQQRVRLIGVDTPEMHGADGRPEEFAVAATRAMRQWIRNRPIRLEFDRERIDKYQRLLAYVFVGDDMLNERLIETGLSRAETQYGYSPLRKKQFLAAESRAREARIGLWADPGFYARNRETRRR